ncbi:hypothetical protein GCM10007424_23440 [Flavobacterium suaedae]|uniref:DUF3164 family protein n=1 Tax=Flavobacterium suaedae TaxID=1767027 RepID=A0ABQ1JZX3_9FLAO|nr:DUF3164 family protein [Flavobacterium suaedae]GGB82719.1 hypothetical protein GCM10007424_23440 [Flavobacterium suaedae]
MAEKPKTAAELRQELAEAEARERAENEKNRKAYETLKDETVTTLCRDAITLNAALADFKEQAFTDTQEVYKLLQEYSGRHRDGKGNFTIESKDGQYRVSYKRQGKSHFDERSHQAEKHIIDFFNSKYEGDQNTKEMIMALLERKKGALDINLIQKLYQFEDRFDDVNWKKGISLLKESYSYNHSKDYINFEHKDSRGEWKSIVLQFTNV